MKFLDMNPGYFDKEKLFFEYEKINKILSDTDENILKREKYFLINRQLIFEEINLRKIDGFNSCKIEEFARITLPKNAQELWRQHKYSIMARNIKLYKEIGKKVSTKCEEACFDYLYNLLNVELSKSPNCGGIRNALEHMWGHIKKYTDKNIKNMSLIEIINEVQKVTVKINEPYLMESTALSEIKAWIIVNNFDF